MTRKPAGPPHKNSTNSQDSLTRERIKPVTLRRYRLAAAAGAVTVAATLTAAGPAAADAPSCTVRAARVFAGTIARLAPDASAPAFQQVPADSFVVMADTQPDGAQDSYGYGWINVTIDGQHGYVTKKYAEGPWLNKRACGDDTILPVSKELQQQILDQGL